jgi:predicted nuclease of predicted toxin-antitoxin system
LKFLVDMQLPPALAVWLQQKGNDVKHAFDAGLGRASDEEILEAAIKEDRIVITADLDFPRLLALIGVKGPGLILFRGGDFSEQQVKELMTRVLNSIPADEFATSLVVVDKKRIRKRRLPINKFDKNQI